MELIAQIAVGVLLGMVLFAVAQVAFWAIVRWVGEHPWSLFFLVVFLLWLGWVAYEELFHPGQPGAMR